MTVRIEGVVHIYDTAITEERPVVDVAEWALNPGDQYLLRGVSGSGKTTLFNIMTGLLRPIKGTIWYDDVNLYSLSEAARDRFRAQHIGYIFQNHFLLNTMSAAENVEMPLAFSREIPQRQWRDHATSLLAEVGLEHRVDYRPSQLSTGQRMRVAVARALVNQPNILFADEPTASLDEETGEKVMDLIQDTCRQNNAMLIVASHDPALVPRFSQFADLQAGQLTIHTADDIVEGQPT